MKVKGFLKDVGGASRVTKMRKELIAKGSPLPDPKDPIRELADLLHPGKQQFTVTEIRKASPTSTTYRFSPVNGHVPVFQSGQYALAARRPREEVRLGATPPPECSYTEDLLGYLLGRAHYQMLHALRQLLDTQALDERSFFILSVLSIRDRLTLDELNAFIAYTGMLATADSMAALEAQHLVALEDDRGEDRYVLTADGREASLRQIALAKAVEEDIAARLGTGDTMALKLLLKRLIANSDPGMPDLWSPR